MARIERSHEGAAASAGTARRRSRRLRQIRKAVDRRSRIAVRKVRKSLGRASARSAALLEKRVKRLPWTVTCVSLAANLLGALAIWRAYRKPKTVADRVSRAVLGALESAGEKAEEVRSRMAARDYGLLAAGAGVWMCLSAVGRLFRRR